MNPTTDPIEYAALIGLDWADQKHDLCLLLPGQATPERLVLANTPEALTAWIEQLRQRFGGRPVAIAWEKTRSGFFHTLMRYDFLVLYPLNAAAVARYRQAFATSRAKDDPTDAELLAELLAKHRDEFRPWKPDTATTRELAALGDIERMFQVSRATVYRWTHGEGMPVRRVGGVTRLPADKVREWAEKHSAVATEAKS